MKHFSIFRHGQTEWNVLNVWQGAQIDAELNETGKLQAKELKDKLSALKVEAVYSSPLCRALQTAIIANPNQVNTYLCPDLRECNFGVAEGKTFAEMEIDYPEIVYAMFHPTPDQWEKKFPGEGSECKKEVFERVRAALLEIGKNSKYTNIGIATHAAVMSSLFAGTGHYKTPVPNCCVAHFVYDEEKNELSFVEMV